jgi:CubicO group peptidase (beta-lactamase class C family)
MGFKGFSGNFNLCVCLVASTLVMGCSSLSKIKVDEESGREMNLSCSSNVREQVDGLVHPLIRNQNTPGMVVAVLNPEGNSAVYSYGHTDGTRQNKMSGDTLFAVGSVTKGFTAELTALLVNDGVFSWDDTLQDLLPSDIALSPDAQKITLRQLVSHTSGLPRQMMNYNVLSKFVAYLFDGENFYGDLDNGRFLEYLSEFKNGSDGSVIYSNLGYALLDYIIELKTERSAEALVSERILQPLGMTQTTFAPQYSNGFDQRAIGHAGDQPKFIRRGKAVPDWHFSKYMVGAASAYSTANDLIKYLNKHIYGTGIAKLDAAFREAPTLGLAWMQEELNGQKITYQSGFIAGYSSFIALDEKHKTAMVVLQNSFNWNNEVGGRILLNMARDIEYSKTCPVPPSKMASH